MEKLTTLWWADRIAATRWITKKSFSRLFVALMFFIIFAAIALGIWSISNAFFRSFAMYEEFGQLTAQYIVHASIVIVLWLALGSSVVAYIGLLLSTSPSLSYLLSLPVSSKTLNIWLFVKSILANFLLMAFVFIPITVAYSNAFGLWNIFFLIRMLLILLCIVLVSSGIGMIMGLISVTKLRGHEYQAGIIGLAVFFCVMIGIIKLIFPPELARLYDISPNSFLTIFKSFPLNNPLLPTAWMTSSLTNGLSITSLFVLSITALIVFICLKFQQSRLIPTLLRMHSTAHINDITLAGYNKFTQTNIPLVFKDWLSIIRNPSETGYAIFLGSMAVFFFLFLSLGIGHRLTNETWQLQLTVFSFAWILFFATAFFLRFLFPLIAREGKSAWYLFTMPITRNRILFSKILLSILLSIPVMIFAGLIWYLLPFAIGINSYLAYISMVVIFTLAISQILLGAILPNFSQSNPEKISTSGMGLVTLLISGFIATLAAKWIGYMMSGTIGSIYFITVPLGVCIVLLTILWFFSQKLMQHWEW